MCQTVFYDVGRENVLGFLSENKAIVSQLIRMKQLCSALSYGVCEMYGTVTF